MEIKDAARQVAEQCGRALTGRSGETVKALSLLQPWASLVACGAKQWETRGWKTKYRGVLAIHSSAKMHKEDAALCGMPVFRRYLDDTTDLPLGSIIAVGMLTEVIPSEEWMRRYCTRKHDPRTQEEYAFGNYAPYRFAWKLESVVTLREPVKCKGALSVWTMPPEVAAQVREQIKT